MLCYHEKHFENSIYESEDVSLGPPSQVAHAASSVCMTYGVQFNHNLQRTDIHIQLTGMNEILLTLYNK